MLYIDTSILVAYYCPEPLSVPVERKLRSTTDLAVSELTEVELYSAVGRKVRDGGLVRQDALRILAEFRTHVETGRFVRHHLSAQQYRLAMGWLSQMEWPLRTLDALHLAMASTLDAIIITADARLADCARGIGLSTQLLRSHSPSIGT